MSSRLNSKDDLVVFIPGALCTNQIFAEQVAGINPFFKAIFIDDNQSKTITAMAKTLLDHAPSRFALVGISMGGYVALEVLRLAPDRVWGAVLISTSPKAEVPTQSKERKRWIQTIESGQSDELVNEIVDACVSEKNTSIHAKKSFHEMVKNHLPSAFNRQMTACATRPDFQAGLKDIRCPVLLIGGEDDSEFFQDGIKEISESVIGSEILTLPNCGHLPTLESPSSTTKAIKQFLLKASK